MVDPQVAVIFNRLVKDDVNDPTRAETINLSGGQKTELEQLIADKQSSGVARQLRIERGITQAPERFGRGSETFIKFFNNPICYNVKSFSEVGEIINNGNY